jgi:hypothetical protein
LVFRWWCRVLKDMPRSYSYAAIYIVAVLVWYFSFFELKIYRDTGYISQSQQKNKRGGGASSARHNNRVVCTAQLQVHSRLLVLHR